MSLYNVMMLMHDTVSSVCVEPIYVTLFCDASRSYVLMVMLHIPELHDTKATIILHTHKDCVFVSNN